MAVQKNFVVKNGLEVNDNLIYADLNQNAVGIGTTTTPEKLQVNGGIGATSIILSGVGTFPTADIETALIETASIDTGIITVGFVTSLSGSISTFTTSEVDNLNVGNADITGITTLGSYVDVNDSVDISNDLNVTGIATIATVDINAGDIEVTNVDTTNLNVTGIATIATISIVGTALSNLVVDGTTILGVTSVSQLNVSGIGTIATLNSTNANLTNISGTNLNYSGIGTINTFVVGTQTGKATISYTTNAARTLTIPSLGGNRTFAFINQDQIFNGTQTFSNLNATGVSTLENVRISSGIITAISGIITTISGTNLNYSGIGTITNIFGSNINVSGIVTASSFIGNGSGLTGIGATVTNDTTTNQVFYPLFTQITSGIVTSTRLATTKLSFNPASGTLTVVDLNSTSDIRLKENIQTVENALETVNTLRGVSFDWKGNSEKSYGVIAQELEEVLPELVKNGNYKSVNYNGLIAVLIESIKELRKEVNQLKEKA